MLKVGLVGIGFMGHGHLDQYLRLMKEGAPVKLVALCDVNQKQFEEQFKGGNMGGMMEMLGGFSVLRLSSMMGMMGVTFTKEELLKMNKKLNRIRKPKDLNKK